MVWSYSEEVERGARLLVKHHLHIKAYVKRYGERASQLLSLAARTLDEDAAAQRKLAEFATSSDDLRDTLDLVACIGPEAAPLLPEIITAYYGGFTIDAFA